LSTVADRCRKRVLPRLNDAGWTDDQIGRERYFSDGRAGREQEEGQRLKRELELVRQERAGLPFRDDGPADELQGAAREEVVLDARDRIHQGLSEELAGARQRIAELEAAQDQLQATARALQASEEKYRALYKGQPTPAYAWQAAVDDFVLVDYNDAAERITRGSVAQLLGARASDLYRDEPQILAEMRRCYAEQSSFSREMLYRFRVTQESKYLAVSYGFVPPDMVLVHTEDITEHVQTEQALQKQHDLVAAILDTAGALVVVLDLEGRIKRFNRACEGTTGYSLQEVEGQCFWDLLIPAEEADTVRAVFRRLAVGQFPNQHENHWIAKDGSRRLIDWSNTALREDSGAVEYVVGTGIDITERRQAEDELRRAYDELEERVQVRTAELTTANQALAENEEMLEERVAARTRELAALYDVTAVANASLDLQTVLDESLSRVLEVMACEGGGIHLRDESPRSFRLAAWKGVPLDTLPEQDTIACESLIVDWVISHGEPLVVSDMSQCPPAPPLTVPSPGAHSYLGAPVHAKGQVLGALSVVGGPGRQFCAEEIALLASIADQVGVAVENARLYQQAERLAVLEERGRLARDLHDAVTQSLYSANLMIETAHRAAEAGHLQRVKRHLRRLGEITRDALKEMRLLVYELRPPALEQERLIGALQKRLDAVEGRAGVETRLLVQGEVDLPAAVEEALYRVAQEALNNALKHAAATSVAVTITAGEGQVFLEVADNGCGFDPEIAQDAGGMGLTSMRQRAERVGGRLSIHSAPGLGTRVQIRVKPDSEEVLK
jgi:PAS domain S-box-containing protein